MLRYMHIARLVCNYCYQDTNLYVVSDISKHFPVDGFILHFSSSPNITGSYNSKTKSPRTRVCTDHFVVCVHKIRAMYYRNTPCKEAHVWLAAPIRSCCIFSL